MDIRQPAINKKYKRQRESNNKNPIENPDVEAESQAQENAKNKRRKQETDPLKMGHILQKVFGFLDVESIKAARQVNPLWNIEGAKSLITKCYVKIPQKLQVGDSSTRNIKIEKFKNFLAHKSKDFSVIPNIIVGNADDFELWKSLGVLGQQVKSLKLKPIDDQAELLHNLFNLLPNLRYLNCEMMGFYNNHSAYMNVIISAMSKREKEGSSLIISSMHLSQQYKQQLEDMEKLADCKNVMIEELAVHYYIQGAPNSERFANALSKLLSTSQNVLKQLTLNDCEYYLHLLEFSCMTALTLMDLNLWSSALNRGWKFSRSFRFSEKVPNLQEIMMAYPRDSTDFLQNLVNSTGVAPSVKRVNRFEGFMDNDVDAIFIAFPNTEELQVYVKENSESNFRSLWTNGKNLKKLILYIDWFPEMGNLLDWDYLFTGFDAETVKKIKETPNLDPLTPEELEELRVNPSIANLKELEHLSIHFSGGHMAALPERMLTVAAKYEISQLPKNPQIDITLNNTRGLREAFDEVSKLPNFIVKFQEYNTFDLSLLEDALLI